MREELKKYIICMKYIESHPELKEEYEQYITQKEDEEICERGFCVVVTKKENVL